MLRKESEVPKEVKEGVFAFAFCMVVTIKINEIMAGNLEPFLKMVPLKDTVVKPLVCGEVIIAAKPEVLQQFKAISAKVMPTATINEGDFYSRLQGEMQIALKGLLEKYNLILQECAEAHDSMVKTATDLQKRLFTVLKEHDLNITTISDLATAIDFFRMVAEQGAKSDKIKVIQSILIPPTAVASAVVREQIATEVLNKLLSDADLEKMIKQHCLYYKSAVPRLFQSQSEIASFGQVFLKEKTKVLSDSKTYRDMLETAQSMVVGMMMKK